MVTPFTQHPPGAGPESKLWWNDGSWWGSLYNPSAQAYHIYRLDNTSRTWVDSGTALDNRPGSKADVLWDGGNQKLYVVSHLFNSTGHPTASSSPGGGYIVSITVRQPELMPWMRDFRLA